MSDEKQHSLAEALHQVRGPIGTIRAAAASLTEGTCGLLPEKAQEMAALIEHAATGMLLTAEGLLNVTPSTRTRVELKKEIAMLVEELRVIANKKHLAFEISIDDSVPELCDVDALALRNGIWNLGDNAVKYTASGSVLVHARAQGGQLSVSVRDTGRGFASEDELKHGLGLPIVRRLVEAAGGQLQASSEGEGKGAEFTLMLPIKPV